MNYVHLVYLFLLIFGHNAHDITTPHLTYPLCALWYIPHKAFTESLHLSWLAAVVFTSREDGRQCSLDKVNFVCFWFL